MKFMRIFQCWAPRSEKTETNSENVKEFKKVYVRGVKFRVQRNIDAMDYIGSGSFGSVIRAKNLGTDVELAIKKVRNAFSNGVLAKRAYREFSVLKLHNHLNLIDFIDAYTIKKHGYIELYFVTKYMQMTLWQYIEQCKELKRAIDQKRISFLIFQVLCGVKHLKKMGIIHRDLKPGNITLDFDGNLKIIDFGLSRKEATGEIQTARVITQWYRSPENIIAYHEKYAEKDQRMTYDSKTDVWSIGCIFAELILQKILFKGEDNWNQLMKIVGKLGRPNESFLSQLSSDVRQGIIKNSKDTEVDWTLLLPDNRFEGNYEELGITAQNARNLISQMLKIDPKERWSVEEALEHDYVKSWHQSHAKLLHTEPKGEFDESIEAKFRNDLSQWKEYLTQQINKYHQGQNFFDPIDGNDD